jgi:hypothetical protein
VAGLVFIFGLEALVHRWLRSETRERVVLAVFYSGLIAFVIDTIPGPLFFLVVVISFAVLGVATLLNTRERGTYVTLLAVLAIVIALNLALIVALEHPFRGSIAVSDQPLRVGVLASIAR